MKYTTDELIKKEHHICDDCKEETLERMNKCSSCHKDLCERCSGRKIWANFENIPDGVTIGYNTVDTYVCKDCSDKYENVDIFIEKIVFNKKV